MVGYDTEDKAYCMELTYNYGLKHYSPGTGLKEFGLFVPDVAAAVKAAKDLKYKVENDVIIGPDQYAFRVLKQPEGRQERFSYVLCRSGNLARSVAFYKDFLGFSDAEAPTVPGLPSNSKVAAVSYASTSHPHKFEPVLLVFYEDGVKPETTSWEGRHAFALDAAEVNAIYEKFKKEIPGQIMHDAGGKPISLEEKLGTLYIFIGKDPDGYELCLVSRETMLPAAVEAVTNYDPKLLSFADRNKRISAIDEVGVEIEKIISANPVAVFSKEYCPFCKKAKEALDSIGAKYFVKELMDTNKQPLVSQPVQSWQDYLAAKTNMGSTVPKVFIQSKCYGGGSEAVALLKSGELLAKCQAAGAVAQEAPGPVAELNFFVNGRKVTQGGYNEYQL